MKNPISISTHGYLILFGKWTKLNLKDTVWERMIEFYLDTKYDIKRILSIK
ncbi:unnamed protein product [marine sediment metagenome]|uniref:Uncharacterized protein n=1 Tax=marine sediment metagenome TaxID=412755 RepID=X0XV83_9ZZZZ